MMLKKIFFFMNLVIFIFYLNISYVISNEKDLIKIYQNIRCLVCQGQSIDESNSEFARDLKLVIKNKIKNGASEKEVYDFLEEKYGEWILLKPNFNYNSLILWFFPYLIFIVGGISLFLLIRKRRS